MSASGNLSPKQFNTEHSLLAQGNTDELASRVRGIQNMTSNVYTPSFSSDYSSVQSMPSPARASESSAQGVMGQEDEEA